jgi:iron complex outermembrane receptor protein
MNLQRSKYRSLALCCASLATLAWGVGAQAQTDNDGTSAANQAGQLDEVVVTARRREERLQDVPTAMTAFTPERLQEAQVTTARQLVGFVPSLNINSGNQRDFQRFALRGQGATVGAGESVTVYFAEAPLSQFMAGGPGLYFDLENLQVLNGPQGTLFGRNTIGGAVLFTPKKPTDRNEGFIQAGYGNYNNREIAGVLNYAAIPGKLALRASADVRKRAGFTRQIADGGELDDIDYKTFRAGILFTPTDKISNYLLASYTKSDTSGTGIVITAVNPRAPAQAVFGLANLQANLAQQSTLGVRTTQGFAPHWWSTKTLVAVNTTTVELPAGLTLKNVASFSRVRASGGFDNDGTPSPTVQWFRSKYSGNPSGNGEGRNEYLTEELQLQGSWYENRLNWVVGGFYQNTYPYGYQEIRGVAFGAPNIQQSHVNSTSSALFGQATLDLGLLAESLSGLKLTGGYRYSWDTRHLTAASWSLLGARACQTVAGPVYPNCLVRFDGKWQAPTYNISLDYKVTPDILVYVSNRTGFKSGGFNSVASALIPASFGPEKVTDYEAGIKADFEVAGMPLRANVAVFRDKYKDIQRTIFLPDPRTNGLGTLTFLSNASSATIKGVEAQVTLKPTHGLQIDVAYSYLDAKYGDYPNFLDASVGRIVNLAGKPLPFAPKNKYGVNVKYQLPTPEGWGELSVNGGVNYQGHYLSTDQVQPTVYKIGGYSLVNFGVNWRNFADTPVDFELFMTNAFDKKAIAAGQVFYYSTGVAAASYIEPRMFGVRLRYAFGR